MARQVPNLQGIFTTPVSRSTLPNALSPAAYDYLNRSQVASENLTRVQLSALCEQLPGFDDDIFVQDFMTLGNEDQAEGSLEDD